MNRWLGLLAVLLLLLSGCTPQTQIATDPGSGGSDPLKPGPGLYEQGSAIEVQTGGAVKAYPLGSLSGQILAAMGKDYLLFGNGSLTLLTGENLAEVVTIAVKNLPMPGSGMVQIQAGGVAFYDRESCAVVFLGTNLREYGRLQLSEKPTGGVYLTEDWKNLYYCTDQGVRVLDLDTGVCRTLKAQTAAWQSISGGFIGGSVLRCNMTLADGTKRTIMISAQTGETLTEGAELNRLTGDGEQYFMPKPAGLATEWIFGQGTGKPMQFWPADPEQVIPLPECGAAVTVSAQEQGLRLSHYDLTGGKRTASLELPGITDVTGLACENGKVWFLSQGVLHSWELALSKTGDETIYVAPRYTLVAPDKEGLAVFEARAKALEQKYGVRIFWWDAVSQLAPQDYSFEVEYLTQVYEKGFAGLEAAMAKFPETFFRKAADRTNSGVLKIVLVRGIYGPAEQQAMTSATGVQYLLGGDSYIALSIGGAVEQNFYHELGHVIDTKVLSSSSVFYEWNKLNPAGFVYANDSITDPDPQDGQYLEGDNRYFIDAFSMRFAVEDRARILEYACMPGNESYFASQYMQAKLQRVCKGIREAFRLPEGTYVWEQYLAE